jgi:hypothetical protein
VSIGGNLHPIGFFPHYRPQKEVLFKKRIPWSKKTQGVNSLSSGVLTFTCDFSGQLGKGFACNPVRYEKPGKSNSHRKVA